LLLGSCLITCLLLVVNRVLVNSIYLLVVPPGMDYARLRTVLQFLFLIVLLLPEWWMIDRVWQFWARLRSASGDGVSKRVSK
jgi:hypothetical protein